MSTSTSQQTAMRRLRGLAGAASALLILLTSACSQAGSPQTSPTADDTAPITVTLVRHAESEGNVGGPPDTGVPGPVLTEKGESQAEGLVAALDPKDFDAVYVSTMVRTQQTAAPLAAALGLDAVILPGVQEASLGIYDGKPYEETADVVGPAVEAWMNGDPSPALSGGDSGESLRDRMLNALEHVYDSGAQNPVIFAHGCSIGCGLMLLASNAKNVPAEERTLDNATWVVLEGTPKDGWIITEWDGESVKP